MERFNFICEVEMLAETKELAIEEFERLTNNHFTYVKEIHNLTELGIIN